MSHCGFNLRFPDDYDVEHLFMSLSAICLSSLETRSILIFCPFLIGLFEFCFCVRAFGYTVQHTDS